MSFQHQSSVYNVAAEQQQHPSMASTETGGFGSVDDVATDSTERRVRRACVFVCGCALVFMHWPGSASAPTD